MAKSDSTHKPKSYQEFIARKQVTTAVTGFEVDASAVNSKLFLFQRDIVRWALHLGKSALFAECGMGKTAMQLEWARLVADHEHGTVLILAPLAVADQTVREGEKFGIPLRYVQSGEDVTSDDKIVISNYDRLHLFDPNRFVGVVLDESSILKNFTGKTRTEIIRTFAKTKFRLACTATPAPNDFSELGNHAEFLGVMKLNQMLSTWYMNDTSDTGTWRLKGHARADYWRWVTSWAVCVSRPSDLGPQYDMPGFDLPPLHINEHHLTVSQETIERTWNEGRLIADDKPSSTGLHKVKRESLAQRVEEVERIVASLPETEPILIWCDTDYEADALVKAFPDAAEVRGSHKREIKHERLRAFGTGHKRILITKPEIAGFGLNYQHCAHQILAGVSFSFERFYQAVRRSYRFGQSRDVNVHLVYAETEGNVVQILKDKQAEFKSMQAEMSAAMHEHGLFRGNGHTIAPPLKDGLASGKSWALYLGDCVQKIAVIPDGSVHFSVYSPPFADLFTYSANIEDMGNSASDDEFREHYAFLIKQMYRVTMPGRLTAVHCADLPSFKYKHGAAGLRDFSGDIIRAHQSAGWIYHSRITIWKDPVTEMRRSKAHGLLHKTFTTNASAVRVGNPDYLLVFRKNEEGGKNVIQKREIGDYIGTEPPTEQDINGYARSQQEAYSIAVWQRYASPVWFDIDQQRTLNYEMAREGGDERHICPLQLDVIERAIDLWTNKGETVLTPFAGIGSEVYSAVKLGRKGIGIELKESYWRHAQRLLNNLEAQGTQLSLFDVPTEPSISLTVKNEPQLPLFTDDAGKAS